MLKTNKNIDWIEQSAAHHPNKKFLIFGDGSLNFKQLAAEVIEAEFHIGAVKLKRGEKVGVICNNNPAFIILVLAIWRKGAVPVVINPRLSDSEIAGLIEEAKPSFIFIHQEQKKLYDKIESARKILFPFDSGGYKRKGNPQYKNKNNDEALILFTSGSTDKPKGVVLTFDNLTASAEAIDSLIKTNNEDIWMASLPFYHIGGFSIIVRALLKGSAIVIPKNLKTNNLVEEYKKYAPTLFSLVPTQLRELLPQNISPAKNLKYVFLGGGPSEKKLVSEAIEKGWKIIKVYGSTETSSMITALTPDKQRAKPESSGVPLPGCKIKIEDDEIVISGKTIFKNYLNDEDHTNKKLRGGKLYSGDTGFIDDEGFLFVTGRKEEMIISGGENINPSEIKILLESHPSIDEAFVFGTQDDKWGEAVTAAILSDKKQIDSEEIKYWLRGKTASYKIPKKIFFLTKLPKNTLGKIEKRRVLEILGIK